MINVDDKVKLNEELCPIDKRTEKRFQFGSLNYFALFLDFEFEVLRTFTDDYHGDMIECKVTDNDKVRSNIVLKKNDVVLAAKTMVRMDFEILGRVNKHQAQIDELSKTINDLVSARSKFKKQGVKISDKILLDNWSEIKKLRAKVSTLEQSPDKVFRVKHKIGTFDLECKEDDIPRKLRSIIRDSRRNVRTLKVVTKDAGGGLTYDKIGGVLAKPAKFLEINEKYAVNIIKEHKTPKTSDNYVGIEIEMLAPKNIDKMNLEFIKARLHKYVNIGTDGSIQVETEGFNAMELRICLPENLLESKLKEICDVLRKNDCYANRSCGMHVHIDMRARDPELCYKNLFKVQGVMLASQPVSRRSNRYCMPNKVGALKLSEFNQGGGDVGRRQVINTQSYNKNNMKTIEIRVHEGATKYKDVLNWVKFLVATASLKTELETDIRSISGLKKADYLSENILNHLGERIEEYSA